MATRQNTTEEAVLQVLQQDTVMTIDEVVTILHPEFTWGEVLFAVDRLSRKQLIALARTGSTYKLSYTYRGDREA